MTAPRSLLALAAATATVTATACAASPRFPSDVHAALADHAMRRLETASLILYYPAERQDQARRFADRAEGCITELRARARIRNGFWSEKARIVMPELPFNNAYVAPDFAGTEQISVVPTHNTVDFVTEYGLPPDPGYIACHEIVHYVQFQQTAGLWGAVDNFFGHILSPQLGLEAWFFEGLAVHYEAALQPGAGRPRWPVFRGMFHAGFAGDRVRAGDLSELSRRAPPGGQYLVGGFFIDFLVERYGEQRLWQLIEAQARSPWLAFNVNGRFRGVYGRSLSALVDEFADWTAQQFPARPTPASQRRLRVVGSDARYTRGPRGDEALIASDLDAPTRLTVWGPDGRERGSTRLTELVPPRTLVQSAPVLTSGLGIAGDGTVYFTAIDPGATYQRTRLLRWNGSIDELATDLGPGAGVSPDGATYYYLAVDGDRWQLAAYDLASRARRVITTTQPGQYIVGAQVSPDGKRLIASVWDGGFVLWLIDAATGARVSEIRTTDRSPVFDGAFADDHTITHLGVVDGRFQVIARDLTTGTTRTLTDAPYAVLGARVHGDTVRFLNRQGWTWTLDEVAFARPEPPAMAGTPVVAGAAAATAPTTETEVAAMPAPAPAPAPPADAAPAPGPDSGLPPGAAAPGATAPIPANPSDSPGLAHEPPRDRAASVAAAIESDRPYSYFDHFFVPQLHALALLTPGPEALLVGGALSGGDRLGFQRYSLDAFVQPKTKQVSGHVSYINAMLAPWMFAVEAGQVAWTETEPKQTEPVVVENREERIHREAALSFGRTWRDSWSAELIGALQHDHITILHDEPMLPDTDLPWRRMAGAGLGLGYVGVDGSRYAGADRGAAINLGAIHYPERLSTLDVPVTDLSGRLVLLSPLPFSRRHSLVLGLRGRAVLTGRDGDDLLTVGGAATSSWLYRHSSKDETEAPDNDGDLPDAISFLEPLRGFEDFGFTTDRIGIAELTWRYPIIIDRGTATTLWLLPPTFFRQIDLQLFATGAVDERGRDGEHAAAGAAIFARVDFLRIPLSLGYQIARRVTDDEALGQLILIGIAQ